MSPQERTPGEVGTGQALKGTDNTAILPQHADERKAFVTLRARAARRGIGLYRIAGGFLICWGRCSWREAPTLAEVEALRQRLEGPA